jgi:hypothetical protein
LVRHAAVGERIDQRPLIVIDFDDALELARYAEAYRPSKEIREIRTAVEAERGLQRCPP